MKLKMNGVGDTLPREQDTMPALSCPRGQYKPWGAFYPKVKCPRGQVATWYLVPGDKPGGGGGGGKINRYHIYSLS